MGAHDSRASEAERVLPHGLAALPAAAGAGVRAHAEALRTVRVPGAMAAPFVQAEDAVGRYFAGLLADPSKGTIEILGERYVLVRGAALSVEFVSLLEQLFGDGGGHEATDYARHMLYDLGHAIGKADARSFHTRMKLNEPVERLSAGPVHFAYMGWASVVILPESHPSPDEDYYLLYDHPFSFEADAWLRNGRRASFPVCILNAGYSSGWCEESFGLPLVASEVLCRAMGDECCRFLMAPPHRLEGRIADYLRRPGLASRAHGHTIPQFLERKHAENMLRQTVWDLERLNRLAVGREMRIIELKREVNALAAKAGLPPPYDLSFAPLTPE